MKFVQVKITCRVSDAAATLYPWLYFLPDHVSLHGRCMTAQCVQRRASLVPSMKQQYIWFLSNEAYLWYSPWMKSRDGQLQSSCKDSFMSHRTITNYPTIARIPTAEDFGSLHSSESYKPASWTTASDAVQVSTASCDMLC